MRLALIHMAIAAFFFSAMALCVKLVPRLPVVEVVFFRALVAGILSLGFLKAQGTPMWGNNRRLLFLRGLFGTGGLCAYFTSLHSLPLATATVLQYLSPIFTALVSGLLLGETVGLRRWLCFGLSFLGVAVLKGFGTQVGWLDLAVGVSGAVCSALAYNCIAKLKTSEDPQVIMFYFPLITVPITFPLMLHNWVTPTLAEAVTLVVTGGFVQAAQYFMTRSYQCGRPAAVSIVSYLGVVFALFWDVTVFQTVPTREALLGIGLVVFGVVLSAVLDLVQLRRRSVPDTGD